MKFVRALPLFFLCCLPLTYAATPKPTPSPKATVTFKQGATSRTLNATAPTACLGIYGTVIRGFVGPCGASGSYVQFPSNGGDVSVHWSAQDVCPPKPAGVRTHAACPAGTTGGGWDQVATYAPAASPVCWVLGTPLPTDPPAGACTPITPPPGGALNIDFAFVDHASPEYADFIAFANRTDEADPQTLAYAYKITGTADYCARAVPQVAAWMSNPAQIRGDSYLQIDQYLAPAMMVREWCPTTSTFTAAIKAAWLTTAKALVDEVWNQGCPGWGVCDLQNNYHDHFVRATVYVAIASGDPARISFALGKFNEQQYAMSSMVPNGGSLEGKGYQYATKWLNDSALVLHDSGYGEAFNSTPFLSANALEWVHATAPDMAHFAPIGSQPRDSPGSIYDYQAGSVREGCYQTTNAAVRAAAGYWISKIPLGWYRANSWDNLWRCPAVTTPPALIYNAKNVAIYARTAWTPSAKYLVAVAYDRSQSHAHSEQGEVMYWLNGGWGTVAGQSLSHSGINGEPPSWSVRAKSVVAFSSGAGAAKDAVCGAAMAPAKLTRGPVLTSAKEMELAAKGAAIEARSRAAMVKACNSPTATVLLRPGEGFPILSNYVENQATGDVSFCLDSSAIYAGMGVSKWQRCVDFTNGIATIDDYVIIAQNSLTAAQQWIVPGNAPPICSPTQCVAGNLKLTFVIPTTTPTITPLSAFDTDFDRGGYVIARPCSGGCRTVLGPAP